MPILLPPATDAEVAAAEQWWGYKFDDQVRELYLYTNGTERCGIDPLRNSLIPPTRDLLPLSALCERKWRSESHSFSHGGFPPKEPSATPCNMLPAFSSGDSDLVLVACDPLAMGAVASRSEGVYWETRSLSELFDRLVDYANRDLFEVCEYGVDFVLDEREGRRWIYEPLVQDFGINGEWRWEPVNWRSYEELLAILAKGFEHERGD